MSDRFMKAYRFLCYEVLFLIAFGGAVRAMDAGLACPDWPLCFGEYIPDFHIQVYFEFLHRVLAGTVGLFVGGFGIYLLACKTVSPLVKFLSVLSILLVVVQIIVGGLTVLMLLNEGVVVAHLILATMLFSSLLWTYWELGRERMGTRKFKAPAWLKGFAFILVGTLWAQILLGGLVASNYAGMVCPDFPLCHGQLIPTLKGVIGLQVLHRLGAYVCLIAVMAFWFAIRSSHLRSNPVMSFWTKRLVLAIWIQVALGIANIVFVIPPLITVLHLAMGTYLLGVALRIAFFMKREVGEQEKSVLMAVEA